MNNSDAVELRFSERDKREIDRCLNCSLPQYACLGLKGCKVHEYKLNKADMILDMAQNGSTATDICERFNVKPKSLKSMIYRRTDVFKEPIRGRLLTQIYILEKEKDNGKQNSRLGQTQQNQAARG